MENPNRSLLQINFEIPPISKARQKLINLALSRDRSAQLATRSAKRPIASVSRERPRSPIGPKMPSKSLSIFISELLKSSSGNKIFTNEMFRIFKSLNFDGTDHKLKLLELENELKCLKPGQSFSSHLIGLIEELAVRFGVTSMSRIRGLKKAESKRNKLLELVSWFNVSRFKLIPVCRGDVDLLKAVLMICGKDCKKSDVLETFKALCMNPGLGVRTVREILDLVKKGTVDRGKVYLVLVEKAYSTYMNSCSYTNNEGIFKLIEIIEELARTFNINSKERKHERENKGLGKETKKELSINPELDEFKENNTNKSAKNILLKNFRLKVRDKNQDGYLSDNTDISENEKRKITPCSKFEKIMNESRFNKKIENLIEEFFKEKISKEPGELLEGVNADEYIWKKLECLKLRIPEWSNECIEALKSSETVADCSESVKEMKLKAVINKLSDLNYLDHLVFKIQSSIERGIAI